jgi:hypothetical protein
MQKLHELLAQGKWEQQNLFFFFRGSKYSLVDEKEKSQVASSQKSF